MSVRSVCVAPAMALLFVWLWSALRACAAFNVLPGGALLFQAPDGERVSGDYFGYSVALASYNGKDWLMAAAPRAQSKFEPQYQRPGAVFRCPPTGGACHALPLLQGTSSDTGPEDPMHVNNGSLGGSMDAILGKNGMVICNPAFKELDSLSEDPTLDMPGICYWLYDFDSNPMEKRKYRPPKDLQIQVNETLQLKDYRTPEFGFSVHHLEGKGQPLLIGSPLVFQGVGAVARFLVDIDRGTENRAYGVAIPLFQEYDYFGYSVTSGRFQTSGQTLYVGSAPRAGELQGKVIVFTYKNTEEMLSNVNILKELSGKQIGEYYGFTLIVADINGDKVDDLLVGAPLHKVTTGDEGKVYIYFSSGKNQDAILNVEEEILPKLKIPNSRFGTSITSLGDIDKDGYGDVAIGAPYEDSERGTVYIFYGSPEKPHLKYEKRIRAQDINKNLMGFGFSFSRGGDIDNNMYNDFAVGAYLSDHAVVLRTSPVLRINSSVTTAAEKIHMFTEVLPVTFCVRPNELQADIGIEVKVNIDPIFNRGSIGGKKINNYIVNFTKTNLKDECITRQLTLKNNTKIYKPLEIELSYVILYPKQPNGTFCKTCPVLNVKSPKTSHFLYYHTGCEGHVCKTNFTLTGNFTGVRSPFTIGSKNMSSIEMVVEVANFLEPSYETNISIVFPSAVKLRQTHKSCYKPKHNALNSTDLTKLICEVPYVLRKNAKPFSLNLHFDMDSVPWDINQLKVNISVEGSGEEQYVADDRLTLLLELLHIANINIKGRSDPEKLSFVFKSNDSDDYIYQDRAFEHIYTVVNNGPSPVYGLVLKFLIPHSLKVGETNITYLKVEHPAHYSLTVESQESNKPEQEESSVSEKVMDDDSLTLDCSRQAVECLILYYNITQTILAKRGVSISFKFTGLFKEQGPRLQHSIVQVISSGNIQNEFLLNQDLPGESYFAAKTDTTLYGNVHPKEGVRGWIIIVAIICGILILLLLCVILWKLGFFKRNKPPTSEEAETEGETETETETEKPDSGDKVDTDRLMNSA